MFLFFSPRRDVSYLRVKNHKRVCNESRASFETMTHSLHSFTVRLVIGNLIFSTYSHRAHSVPGIGARSTVTPPPSDRIKRSPNTNEVDE